MLPLEFRTDHSVELMSCVSRPILNTDPGDREHSSVAKFGAIGFS